MATTSFVFSLPNPFVRALLRSPLRGLAGRSLTLLTVTGKKTGQRHTFPVLYARDGADVIIVAGWASKKRWWKNVIGGGPVELTLRGQRRTGRATAFVDDPAARGAALRAWLRRFPRAARNVGAPRDFASLDDAALGATGGDAVTVRVVLDEA